MSRRWVLACALHAANRLVLWLLASPLHRVAGGSLLGLEVTGRHTGHHYRFPVSGAPHERGLVVLPGRPDRKQWWRNLDPPCGVLLLRDGRWGSARAQLLRAPDPAWAAARSAYQQAHRKVAIAAGTPLVLLTRLDGEVPSGTGP